MSEEMLRTDLISWPVRIASVSEAIKDGNPVGFTLILRYNNANGDPHENKFHLPADTDLTHLLVGNEITICLEARS